MRQGVRQVCPVRKPSAFSAAGGGQCLSRYALSGGAARSKKTQRLAAGRCANLRRKTSRRSCFALPRCASVKKTEGTFGGATVCPAPACLGKMATTLAARFLRGTSWRGHLFRHYAGRFASFVPTAFALCSVQLAKIRPRMVRAPRLVLFTFWFAAYDNASAMVRGRTPPKVRA